jgi:hypothetical protein
LDFDIQWHPNDSRNPLETVESYLDDSPMESKSGITIDGSKAILVKYKEQKYYQGKDEPALISDSMFLR